MPKPTIYSYTIQDSEGATATHDVYTAYDAATETVGALVGNFAAYGGLLDAVTGGQIIDGNIKINVAPDPSWKSAPAAGSKVVSVAVLNFKQADTPYAWGTTVPAILDSLVSAGKLIIASGALHTLIGQLINQTPVTGGIGLSGTVFANSPYSNALIALKDAFLGSRKRKSLKKVSFEKG